MNRVDDSIDIYAPPWWSESRIYERGLQILGELIGDLPPSQSKGVDPGALYEKAHAAAVELKKHENPGADPRVMLELRQTFTDPEITFLEWKSSRGAAADDDDTMTAAEFLASTIAPDAWAVDGLFREGGLVAINGWAGAGKTSLARPLAIACAREIDWLGRSTKRGKVLYLSAPGEGTPGELLSAFTQLGLRDDDEVHINMADPGARSARFVARLVERQRPDYLIVDTLQAYFPIRDGNSYSDAAAGLAPLLALVRGTGVTAIVLHHSSKGAVGGFGKDILGSTKIGGVMDTALQVGVDEADPGMPRYISTTKMRGGRGIPKTYVTIDPETGWPSLGDTIAGRVADALESAILDFVYGAGQGVSRSEIASAVDGGSSRKQAVLAGLVDAGRVQRTGRGVAADPHVYAPPHTPASRP